MGSPESEDNGNRTNNIDPTVGGLVWVRRRNGSWWPGRILGLDEVSEGCLVSPRSGTPVKLLGREDASVDWYNLEKSKRVKAFRCGEYDECIQKAKASAANSGKKAVKYARREDAILHALELESARLGMDHPDYWVRPDNSGGEVGLTKESPVMSHSSKENEDMSDETSDSADCTDSAPELSQSGVSFEESNHTTASKALSVQGKRRRTPNDSEDDGMEGSKRMRGLEDLGMGIGSKRKVQAVGGPELAQQESASLSDSYTENMSNGGPVNGNKSHTSSLKRKRTQVANIHECLKKRNRRRPLTKVLESTAMVSVPIVCDQLAGSNGSPLRGLSDSKVSGVESNESRKSLSVVINNNSESTVVSCENGVHLNSSEHDCDASQINHKKKESEISCVPGEVGKDKLFDVPFVGADKHSAGFSPMLVPCSTGRPEVGVLGRQSSQCSQGETVSLKNEGLNESGSTSSAAAHVNNISQRMEKGTSKWQLKGKRNSRQMIKNRRHYSRRYVVTDDEPNAYAAGTEQLDGFPQGSDQKVDCDGIHGSKSKNETEDHHWGNSVLQREPQMRTTEVKLLSDGSINPRKSLPFRQTRYMVHSRFQMSDYPVRNFCVESSLYDIELEVKASYKPQHVPLVSLMSKLNGKAIVGHPLTVKALPDGYCDDIECDATHVSLLESAAETSYAVKQNSEAGRISTKNRKLSSRFSPNRRKNGILSKKTRKLSSLTVQAERKPVVEKPKGPVIACIPLKLVFSRIKEAVNGSARPAHRALASSNS
ncbi:uncharacterized protein At1g51745-like [Mangifera indica]|uniref:uncharacterized protein At1g51745-like n=1 Tax=Mangifera indica TaxID=29780 RepID=UPI001CFB9A0B|nr:uncharacterized protein At1g51745-like [Mangifera indica]XP_044496959.1 uncharacterized protein At1g51745-like [Mangifera indica]